MYSRFIPEKYFFDSHARVASPAGVFRGDRISPLPTNKKRLRGRLTQQGRLSAFPKEFRPVEVG